MPIDYEKGDVCFVIPAYVGTEKERRKSDWLFDSVIGPVFHEYFPDFAVEREGGIRSDELTELSLRKAVTADLLIAEVTGARAEVMYQLGMRHSTGRPTIVMREPDSQPWFDVGEVRMVLYVPHGPTESVRQSLRTAVEELFAERDQPPFPEEFPPPVAIPEPLRPRVGSRGELADRLRSIASAISDLRINSLQQHAEELEQISSELESDKESTKGVPEAAEKALKVLTRLLDALGSKRGAQILVAGSVAGILSIGGWRAVSVYALTLAAWQGKEAFLKALQTMKRK
jgi:hypothetical protein